MGFFAMSANRLVLIAVRFPSKFPVSLTPKTQFQHTGHSQVLIRQNDLFLEGRMGEKAYVAQTIKWSGTLKVELPLDKEVS